MTGLTKTRRTTLGHVCVVRYQRVDSVGNGTFRTLYSGGSGVCLQEVIPFAHSVLGVRTACELRGVVPQPVGVAGVLAAGGPSTRHAGCSGRGLVTGRAGFLVMLLGPCCPPRAGRGAIARQVTAARTAQGAECSTAIGSRIPKAERGRRGCGAADVVFVDVAQAQRLRRASGRCLSGGLLHGRTGAYRVRCVSGLLVAEPTRSRNCRAVTVPRNLLDQLGSCRE
jgi:hypothetical protein